MERMTRCLLSKHALMTGQGCARCSSVFNQCPYVALLMKSVSNLRLSLHTSNTGISFALRDIWRPKFKTGTASSAAHCHIPTQSQPLINPRRQTSHKKHKRVSWGPFQTKYRSPIAFLSYLIGLCYYPLAYLMSEERVV